MQVDWKTNWICQEKENLKISKYLKCGIQFDLHSCFKAIINFLKIIRANIQKYILISQILIQQLNDYALLKLKLILCTFYDNMVVSIYFSALKYFECNILLMVKELFKNEMLSVKRIYEVLYTCYKIATRGCICHFCLSHSF